MTVFAGVALLRYPATSRLTFILAWVLAGVFVVAGRALVQLVATLLHQRGVGVERVLVVGGNNLGRIIMQSLAARAHLGYQVVGFVDDDRAGDFGRFRHLGGLDDVERLADERADRPGDRGAARRRRTRRSCGSSTTAARDRSASSWCRTCTR